MAKLLKTSIFFLLAAFLLIAEANHHEDKSDDEAEASVGKVNLKLKIPKFRSSGGSGSIGSASSGASSSSSGGGGGGSGDEGCKCNDAKFREFIKKFGILYRAYASKELAPDLKSILSKMTDFTMNYLAKEKPNEINRFHSFLQNSAKVTSSAVAQTGVTAFH